MQLMIRVLIADDSAFMRKVLSDLFSSQPDFEVVGTARNGKEAIEKTRKLHPDLLTMDVQMPVMDGLNALAVIMAECPLPVVMISSLTQEGTDETVRALSLGAVDFISKDGGQISRIDRISEDILRKCRAAAGAQVARNTGAFPPTSGTEKAPSRLLHLPFFKTKGERQEPEEESRNPFRKKRQNPLLSLRKKHEGLFRMGNKGRQQGDSISGADGKTAAVKEQKLVVIGTSTGGPQALQNVITRLPADLPCGVVVVQHMPAGFTRSLAERLDSISRIHVKEAEQGERIRAGTVYIAPGNYHLRVEPSAAGRTIRLSQDPPVGNHRPAVNVLFDSVADIGRNLVAVIMTGMGEDGCEGMKRIKDHGGYAIAQDEASSVIYGMPKAVAEAGLADEICPVTQIAQAIVAAVYR